jgi:hypothetical protein
MKKLAILLIPLAFSGCVLFSPAVPESRFKAKFGTNEVSWSNPKNFTCTNMSITVDPGNGMFTLGVGFASSLNDAGIVNSGYAGQAAYIEALTRMIEQIGTQAAANAALAASKGVK